jgi:hypothetical protein
MSEQGGAVLLDRWIEDESFRTALRSDPLEAIRRIGVEPTDEERQWLTSVDWTLSDQELEALLEKRLIC